MVVSHPASVSAACFVAGSEEPIVLAVKATKTFFDTEFYKRCSLSFVELPEAFWLIRCDAEVLHDFCTAPRGRAF